MTITCIVEELSESPRRFARLYYQTDHSLKEVRAPGYFAPAAQALRRCDIIEVWAGSGSEPVYEELVVVGVTAAGGRKSNVRVRPLSELCALPTVGSRARGRRSSTKMRA